MAAQDNAIADQTKYLGFADVGSGYAAKQLLKSSISPYNVLDNVIEAKRIMEASTKATKVLAKFWCPGVTLAAAGVGIVNSGLANFAIGSRAYCANGIAIKTGDMGVDTWVSVIGS